MTTTPVSWGSNPWQGWAEARAARGAQQNGTAQDPSGVGAAAGKLASDLGSFVAQLTGAASPAAGAASASGTAATPTAATTAAAAGTATDGTASAATLATDLQAFLTQLQSIGGAQAQNGQVPAADTQVGQAPDTQAADTQAAGTQASGAKPAHHHHHHGPGGMQPGTADAAAAGTATTSDSGSASPLLAPQASAEFVDRMARAFRSYAAQLSTANSAMGSTATTGTASVTA